MGGRKKRNDTTTSLRSSSLRRDSVSTTTKTTQHVTVGCMSGIFHFVSKYHTNRKFLTSGKKHERKTTTSPKKLENATCQSENNRILSSEVTLEIPRSPTIPAGLRRQSSSDFPRKMSRETRLNIIPATSPAPETMAAEKKRKLLGALEKCDEDLQALKRIIEAVRGVQTPPATPPPCGGGGGKRKGGEEEGTESEEPSPVSVIEHHRMVARSPNMSCCIRIRQEESIEQKHEHQQIHHQGQQRDITRANAVFPVRNKATMVPTMAPTTSPWSSATRECVIQVCKAIECGHRQEVGMLVLVLEDLVFRDLLNEFINDLCCLHYHSDFEVGKRKMSF
ncbi:hypothetical protein RND81_05G175900 [Saponaria officinalis]|uniref:Uncharacterized protein n=1 Tax=Saponaria officinalis TaxID=3572 RepID=A0AAW1KTB0_SAPOF